MMAEREFVSSTDFGLWSTGWKPVPRGMGILPIIGL
jgi:hypothetical protein